MVGRPRKETVDNSQKKTGMCRPMCLKIRDPVSLHLSFLLKSTTVFSSLLGAPHMGVSKYRGTPKSSILIGFSIINHPFWGTPIFGNTHIETKTCEV